MGERTYLSLFSGVEGIGQGLNKAGWRCVGQVENDRFCRKILALRYPNVPKWGDVRDFGCDQFQLAVRRQCAAQPEAGRDGCSPSLAGTSDHDGRPDLITGGFPCQDVSVAGHRAGLAGARSGLFWEFDRIIGEFQPRWFLLENVPGLLSSHRGRDMALVVGALVERGYGVVWRILDARHFGVAQRRRRLFIVGCLGDLARAEQVLFEPQGGEGDIAAGGEAREGTASEAGSGVAKSLRARPNASQREDSDTYEQPMLVSPAVRRLTPTECCRLMSWPDWWNCLETDNDGLMADGLPYSTARCRCPDGPRYATCGNGVVSNLTEWIGRRMTNV